MAKDVFDSKFVGILRQLISVHHEVYATLSPQGIFFEALVEQAFRRAGWPKDRVTLTTPNSPKHDLMVGNTRISLKTETGTGTKRDRISITKLCTTETGAWDSPSLIKHTLAHLGRYEVMVMLRAVWGDGILHYQFLDIPLSTLRLMSAAVAVPVGRRKGRQSLGADIVDSRSGDVLFHVHFDGADGKCQIRNLRVDRCRMLTEWDQAVIL